MTTVLAVAPHPDDETLGCGGTLLRHRAEGDDVHWMVATAMTTSGGYSDDHISTRDAEIEAVGAHYGFAGTHLLKFPAAQLDTVPRQELVEEIANVLARVVPDVVYLPNPGDVHGDHAAVFEACANCLKWTKAPSVQRVQVYETLSETELAISGHRGTWRPTAYVEITEYLDRKIAAMSLYASEFGSFPFPRSEEAIRALAAFRGVGSGFAAAEAFQILLDRR
jgi:LmbE family N-acetylglucosaminyl deacetylase